MTRTKGRHDSYVYKDGHLYTWNCPCGAQGSRHRRRMDADDEAAQHDEEAV